MINSLCWVSKRNGRCTSVSILLVKIFTQELLDKAKSKQTTPKLS